MLFSACWSTHHLPLSGLQIWVKKTKTQDNLNPVSASITFNYFYVLVSLVFCLFSICTCIFISPLSCSNITIFSLRSRVCVCGWNICYGRNPLLRTPEIQTIWSLMGSGSNVTLFLVLTVTINRFFFSAPFSRFIRSPMFSIGNNCFNP